MKKSLMILLINSALLAACNSGGSDSVATNKSNQQVETTKSNMTTPLKENLGLPTDDNWVTPGLPTYKSSELPVQNEPCVNVITHSHGASAYSTFTEVTKETDIASKLGISAAVSGGWGGFTASTANSFSQSSQSSGKSLSFTFISSSTIKDTFDLNESKPLTDSGMQTLIYAKQHNDPSFFYERCGDSYVNSADDYKVLATTIKIDFDSYEEAQEFETKNKAGLGSFGEVEQALQTSSSSKEVNGAITITGYQSGGNPDALNQIFKGESKDGKYPLTSCSIDKMSDCQDTMNKVLEYASGDFTKQERTIVNLRTPGFSDYAHLMLPPSTPNYDELQQFITTLNPKTPSDEVKKAQNDLLSLQGYINNYTKFFDAYDYNHPAKYDSKYIVFLRNAYNYVHDAQTQQHLDDYAADCYSINDSRSKACIKEVAVETEKYLDTTYLMGTTKSGMNISDTPRNFLDNHAYFVRYIATNQTQTKNCHKQSIYGGYTCDDFLAVPIKYYDKQDEHSDFLPRFNQSGDFYYNNEAAKLGISSFNEDQSYISSLLLNQSNYTSCNNGLNYDDSLGMFKNTCYTQNSVHDNTVYLDFINPGAMVPLKQ